MLPRLISWRERVCVHSFSCVFPLLSCVPAYVKHIHHDYCDLVSLCTSVCVLNTQGAWPVLLLFLDNGCIYTLILDYMAVSEDGFLSDWCMKTAISIL